MMKHTVWVLVLAACTAKTISPPLTARGSPDPHHTFDHVRLTSGAFTEPVRVLGVVQMTQTGYKWLHEIEVEDDARPDSLLFNIGSYARSLGADGIQHLRVIDLDPQTPAEVAEKKINSVVNIHNAIEKKQYASIAGEGTKTRWEVRGELVQFLQPQGGQP